MADFQDKRREVEEHMDALHALIIRLFPMGGPISWRCENSHNEDGTVISHLGNGCIRVVDDRAQFYVTITAADIVRATP